MKPLDGSSVSESSTKTPEQHANLRRFGDVLRQARLSKKQEEAPTGTGHATDDPKDRWTQEAVAARMGLGPTRQSIVAQLESGRITNPSATLLEKMAGIYGGAVHPDGFQIDLASLQAELFRDKYGLSDAKVELLRRQIKKVSELAEWEESLRDLRELWIVAPNFVDHENTKILNAVLKQLKQGATLVYFVNEEDTRPEQRFDRFKTLLEMHPSLQQGAKGQVWWYGITPEERRFFTCSYVIANPLTAYGIFQAPPAEGYTILPNAADLYYGPYFGIQTDPKSLTEQVKALVDAMVAKTKQRCMEEKLAPMERNQILKPNCHRPDALCFNRPGKDKKR